MNQQPDKITLPNVTLCEERGSVVLTNLDASALAVLRRWLGQPLALALTPVDMFRARRERQIAWGGLGRLRLPPSLRD